MRGRVGVALLATLTALEWTTVSRAEASHVLLVRQKGADVIVDRAEVRLAAELRAAGFEVDERTAGGDDDARKLVEQPGEAGAFATVLLQRAPAGASTDVWVADHVTHKTVVRRIDARGKGDAADRALALKVVELMRASLVEAMVMPPPADAPPPAAVAKPPPDVARWTREAVREPEPELRPFRLSLGAAGTFGGPGVGVALAPELHVAWRPSSSWSVGVLAAGPALGAKASGSEGTADVRQELAMIEGTYEVPLAPPLRAFVAADVGAFHMQTTGTASAPYTSTTAEAWSALFGAGLGLSLTIAGPASLVLDAHELFAAPRPVIAFASDRVATVMSPGTLVALSLSVEP
jgi:hypothetical protein